jgi:hypothetical protein
MAISSVIFGSRDSSREPIPCEYPVLLLEERSAKVLLEELIDKLLPDGWNVRYVVFEGKQDLERNVVKKLRGWQAPNSHFVVLRDQDAGDCTQIKARLRSLVLQSGREALIRVACKELEAWVLGDLKALADAYGDPRVADRDVLTRPITEVQRLVPTYQKMEGARRLGPKLDPTRSLSRSFRAFCDGVRRFVRSAESARDGSG